VKPTLLVLAAGMGSRYGGLKQVDPVGPNGEILLEYSAYDALRAGFGRIVFVVRRDIEPAFREAIGSRLDGRISVDYVHQELDELPEGFTLPPERKKPWGTGHAVWCARNAIHEPFLSINADDYYGPRSYALMAEFMQSGSQDYSMVGFHLRNTLSDHGSVARGLCQVDQDGWLLSVVEHVKIFAVPSESGSPVGAESVLPDESRVPLTGGEVVSMNFWGLNPRIFGELDQQLKAFLTAHQHEPKSELYIPSALDHIIQQKRGRVKVVPSPERWFGVTYAQDKPVVVQEIRARIDAGVYPDSLWK
jgi:UTP-glucose-1-phosphate uridylyltransferase